MITAKKLRRKAVFMASDANFKFILAKLEECDPTRLELSIPLVELPENYSNMDMNRYCAILDKLGFYLPDYSSYGYFRLVATDILKIVWGEI